MCVSVFKYIFYRWKEITAFCSIIQVKLYFIATKIAPRLETYKQQKTFTNEGQVCL